MTSARSPKCSPPSAGMKLPKGSHVLLEHLFPQGPGDGATPAKVSADSHCEEQPDLTANQLLAHSRLPLA